MIIGALLLMVSLFLDWFDPGWSAWTVFEVWDLVLAACAVAVLAAAAAEIGLWRGPSRPVPAIPIALGVLVVVVVALINHPPAAVGRDLEPGAWLALAAAVLLLGGALLPKTRVRVSFTIAKDDGPVSEEPPAPAEPSGTTRIQP